MTLHIGSSLTSEIFKAVQAGRTPSEIADIVEFHTMNQNGNKTFANHIALSHFIGESMNDPEGYTYIDGHVIREMVEGMAESIDRHPLGPIITAEFWSWSDFIQYDLIGEVSNVVADAAMRFGTKQRGRFR